MAPWWSPCFRGSKFYHFPALPSFLLLSFPFLVRNVSHPWWHSRFPYLNIVPSGSILHSFWLGTFYNLWLGYGWLKMPTISNFLCRIYVMLVFIYFDTYIGLGRTCVDLRCIFGSKITDNARMQENFDSANCQDAKSNSEGNKSGWNNRKSWWFYIQNTSRI